MDKLTQLLIAIRVDSHRITNSSTIKETMAFQSSQSGQTLALNQELILQLKTRGVKMLQLNLVLLTFNSALLIIHKQLFPQTNSR